jgi:hypothetical protein
MKGQRNKRKCIEEVQQKENEQLKTFAPEQVKGL